ncbi:MAG: hypothetical protein AB8F78_10940 [Saprospiraceae bacterium]
MRFLTCSFLALMLTSVACDKEEPPPRYGGVSFGFVNGEIWEAKTSLRQFEACESYILSLDVYTESNSLAQEIAIFFYAEEVGDYQLYSQSFNDQSTYNCSRWPDTTSVVMGTADDDLVTAIYRLAPEIGPSTMRLDSVNDDRTYFEGELNMHFINPGFDTRAYQMQLPDTVAFTDLKFEMRLQ